MRGLAIFLRRNLRAGWWFLPVFVAAPYLPGLLGGRILYFRDLGSHQIGWRLLWAHVVRTGRLPLWDPLTLGGTPMLANPNTLSLYPPSALFLLLPPAVALAAFFVLHQLLLGIGTALLLRRLTLPPRAALVGAVAAAGSGLAFSQTTFMAGPLTWIPFLLAAAVAPPRRPAARARRLAEAAGAGAMILLAGQPAVALLGWAAWGVVTLVSGPRSARRLATAAAAPLLAAAIAAPQILTALEIVPGSWRSSAGIPPAAVAADSFAPRRWPELVLPRLYGLPTAELPRGFWAGPSFPWQRYELGLHLGTISLVLLLLAARDRRSRPWFLGTILLAGLAAMPGLLVQLRRIVPAAGLFRYTIKFLLPAVVVAAPALAAGAVRAWEAPGAFRRWAFRWIPPLMLLWIPALHPPLLAAGLARLFPASASNLALPGVAQAVAANLRLDLAVALLPLLLAAAAPRRLLLPALAVQLILGGSWVLRWDDARLWMTPPPLAAEVGPGTAVLDLYEAPRTPGRPSPGADPVRHTFRALRAGLAGYYGILWGVGYRGVEGPDGLEPAWMRLLAARFRTARPLDAARAARHVGASWLVTNRDLPPGPGWTGRAPVPGGPEGAAAYRLDADLPRAWLASEVVSVPSEGALWQTLIDPATTPGAQAVVLSPRPLAVSGGGRVRIVSHRPGRWTVEVETGRPGLLVVNQADSVLWRAADEGGERLATVRVNGFLLGVSVPPGVHTVRLWVDSSRLRLGFWISLAGLLITALLAWGVPTRGRPSPSGGAAPTRRATPPER